MILAAGLGTRLRPLTDTTPKALIDVGGMPMLERAARRLIDAGADRLIINVHHHADQIRSFVESRDSFGVETIISDESGQLLDTGGALLHAGPHFRRNASFFLYNADILSDIDLTALYSSHGSDPGRLATLAVMDRPSSRYLVFDSAGRLQGFGNSAAGTERCIATAFEDLQRIPFCGVHVISPHIFDRFVESGAFSIIIPLYMRLASEGAAIVAHRVDGARWIDIGSHDQLARARLLFADPAP